MKSALLFLIFLVGIAIAPLFGAESLHLSEIFTSGSTDHEIFFRLRLPRVLFAALVGGALSILGATYQIIFQNPLSEPYVLGISSAATLGIVLSEMLLGVAAISWAAGAFGFLGGALVTVVIILFAQSRMGKTSERVLLFGIGWNFVLSSILFILLSFQLQSSGQNFRFLFGQIPWLTLSEAGRLWTAVFPLLFLLWILGRKLDALSFGDSTARTMGVAPRLTRNFCLALTSLILCILVIYTGSIGFVGLAIPHVTRLWIRPQSTRRLLEVSFVLGGLFLVVADITSRVLLPPYEFPVGTITTLLGGPIFIAMLWKR